MGSKPFKCEICGAQARVHVTNDVAAPGRLAHYCLNCADADDLKSAIGRKSRNRSAVVMALGFFVVFIALVADYLRLGSAEGVALRQVVILAICAMLIGVGALMRTATILIVGVAITGVTLLADQLALGAVPGFGMRQRTCAAVGMLIILSGFFAFRKARRAFQ